jgi:hypothetical protein
MSEERARLRNPRLTTPRAAAVAGILFAVLFTASLVLMRTAIPLELAGGVDWVVHGRQRLSIAVALVPFAGIAFLWFIGVIRDLLGELEDQFFATVFFGSSLLFLAMIFVSMAIAGGILASVDLGTSETFNPEIIIFGRAVMLQVSNVYALRMAAVFMISLGTIWMRTRVVPRWLAVVTYLLAAILLLINSLNLWVVLVFPGWVFMVSVYVLVVGQRAPIEGRSIGPQGK